MVMLFEHDVYQNQLMHQVCLKSIVKIPLLGGARGGFFQ
jgi:hypothetical protein